MKKVLGKNFWLLMTMTGALMFGAPALVSASEGTASTDTENSAADDAANTPDDDTIAKTTDSTEKNSQETDHSGEGQISKPKYLENAENSGEEVISDEDPTDNTYGYYTIMGGTTVSVDEMCSLYNNQGCTYPSEELSGGGASDIVNKTLSSVFMSRISNLSVFFLIYFHNPFLQPSRRHKDFPGFPAIPRKVQSLLSRNRSVHLHIPDSGNLWRRRL